MKKSSVKIGITLGDPAGIGPEVALRAVRSLSGTDAVPVVCGRYEAVVKNYPDLARDYTVAESFHELAGSPAPGKKYFFNIHSDLPVPSPGKGSSDTGREARIYIDTAVDMWKAGLIDALVTGPVNKGFMDSPGFRFTGHTEYIAWLINEDNPYMMMFSRDYRVLLVTTHIPVSDIPASINAEKIYSTILAAHESMTAIDGGSVKLAIAGLDPHCGDSGAIGNFDDEVTRKAVLLAVKNGINIEGPFAADTLFVPERWRSYNMVIAQYHDQGLIPFKVLAFESGVNVTLGLSIIRTSPDHGTAYDIAGRGGAKYGSMLEAVKLACLLARKKKG